MKDLLTIRSAGPGDVPAIHRLLAEYAARQIVLPRSEEDIRYYLGNFVVAESHGAFRGCVAVRDFGNQLLEIRSLAVRPEAQGRGVGRAMIEAVKSGLRLERGSFRLFALTVRPEFFRSLGFRVVGRELFPEKIWSDCSGCPKLECCDEIAVLWEPPAAREKRSAREGS